MITRPTDDKTVQPVITRATYDQTGLLVITRPTYDQTGLPVTIRPTYDALPEVLKASSLRSRATDVDDSIHLEARSL